MLPWVSVKRLASSLLALAARRLPEDWMQRNAYRPVLMDRTQCERTSAA